MHTPSRVTQISALALGIAGALAFGQAHAAGFQLRKTASRPQGRADGRRRVAKGDASVVGNNPAAMSTFDTTTFQIDVTVIDLIVRVRRRRQCGGRFAARAAADRRRRRRRRAT